MSQDTPGSPAVRGKYADLTALITKLTDAEKELARAALQRFAAGELTLGEIYEEYGRWEQHAAVLATYPDDDPRREHGIAYAESRMNDLARQGNRILSANKGQISKRNRVFPTPDFARAHLVDLVDLAETLGYHPAKHGRNYVMSCPWHGSDSDPSLTIFEPGLGWYCFGCHRGGQDATSFAAEHFSCSQVEALHLIEELCDVPG